MDHYFSVIVADVLALVRIPCCLLPQSWKVDGVEMEVVGQGECINRESPSSSTAVSFDILPQSEASSGLGHVSLKKL